MTRTEMHKRVAELKAENLPPLTWRDVFTPKEGAEPPTPDDQARLDDYLKAFVAWPKNDEGEPVCICCRHRVYGGLMGALGMGGAPGCTTFKYGLAHGETYCDKCGWPARANHYDIGGTGEEALVKRMTVNLLYHPSGLEPAIERAS